MMYSINVAVNGKHLFRTDWEQDKELAMKAYDAICACFPRGTISLTASRRDEGTVIAERTSNGFPNDVERDAVDATRERLNESNRILGKGKS